MPRLLEKLPKFEARPWVVPLIVVVQDLRVLVLHHLDQVQLIDHLLALTPHHLVLMPGLVRAQVQLAVLLTLLHEHKDHPQEHPAPLVDSWFLAQVEQLLVLPWCLLTVLLRHLLQEAQVRL